MPKPPDKKEDWKYLFHEPEGGSDNNESEEALTQRESDAEGAKVVYNPLLLAQQQSLLDRSTTSFNLDQVEETQVRGVRRDASILFVDESTEVPIVPAEDTKVTRAPSHPQENEAFKLPEGSDLLRFFDEDPLGLEAVEPTAVLHSEGPATMTLDEADVMQDDQTAVARMPQSTQSIEPPVKPGPAPVSETTTLAEADIEELTFADMLEEVDSGEMDQMGGVEAVKPEEGELKELTDEDIARAYQEGLTAKQLVDQMSDESATYLNRLPGTKIMKGYAPFMAHILKNHPDVLTKIDEEAEGAEEAANMLWEFLNDQPELTYVFNFKFNPETQSCIYDSVRTLSFSGFKGFNDFLAHPGKILGIQEETIVFQHRNQARKHLSKFQQEDIEGEMRTFKKRFKQEGEIMQQLSGSKGLVRWGDWIRDENGEIFGMWSRLVPGGQNMFEALRDCPTPKIIQKFINFLEALKVAHDKGVIHRDLKPENVLWNPEEGEDGLPEIIDFGIALNKNLQEALTENPHAINGTPAYMAPEQFIPVAIISAMFKDKGDVLMKARKEPGQDLYAAGIMLHEMVTDGYFPFNEQAKSAIDLFLSKLYAKPHKPEGVSDELWRVIEKAIQIDPERRYKKADEMIADLKALKPEQLEANAK